MIRQNEKLLYNKRILCLSQLHNMANEIFQNEDVEIFEGLIYFWNFVYQAKVSQLYESFRISTKSILPKLNDIS